jgi:nucleoside-diphosphate-sugar epimerase
MKILITGIAGFVGCTLAKVLCDAGYSILGLDIKDISDKSADRIEYINCDLSVEKNLISICKNVDIVIHLAGISNIGEAKELYRRNNILASARLIDAVIKNYVKKIIFLSTVKVDEIDDYGSSKYDIENLIKDKTNSNNTSYTIIRSNLVFGAGMKSNICQWILRIKNSFMPVLPATDSELAMIGVNDLCNCIQICIENNITNNKTYILSDNNNYKINEIESIARKHLQKNSSILFPTLFFTLGAKVGDLICLFSIKFPFNTRIKNILFNSKPLHEKTFQIDTGYNFQQNFLTEIPLIFPHERIS